METYVIVALLGGLLGTSARRRDAHYTTEQRGQRTAHATLLLHGRRGVAGRSRRAVGSRLRRARVSGRPLPAAVGSGSRTDQYDGGGGRHASWPAHSTPPAHKHTPDLISTGDHGPVSRTALRLRPHRSHKHLGSPPSIFYLFTYYLWYFKGDCAAPNDRITYYAQTCRVPSPTSHKYFLKLYNKKLLKILKGI